MDEDLIFDYPYIKSITREIRLDYLTKIAKTSVEIAMQKFGIGDIRDDIREISIENAKVLLPADMHSPNTMEEIVEIIDATIDSKMERHKKWGLGNLKENVLEIEIQTMLDIFLKSLIK